MIFRINPRITFVQFHEIEVQLFFRLIHYYLVGWGRLALNNKIDTEHSVDRAADACDRYPVVPARVFCGAIAQLKVVLRRIDTSFTPCPFRPSELGRSRPEPCLVEVFVAGAIGCPPRLSRQTWIIFRGMILLIAALSVGRRGVADRATLVASATFALGTPDASLRNSTIGGQTMWLYTNSADR